MARLRIMNDFGWHFAASTPVAIVGRPICELIVGGVDSESGRLSLGW